VNRREHGGFTLIEVLVALVIVAVGMSALMGALSSSARSVTYMQEKTFSEWVALNQIANLRLQLTQGQVPPTGNTNGDTDFAGRSWHWRQEVVATQVTGIMRIDVKVRPKELKAGDDDSWYVTVSGLVGNALAQPGSSVSIISWGDPPVPGQPGQPGGGAGTGTPLGGGTTPGGGPNNTNPTGTPPQTPPQPPMPPTGSRP
jgi:general secretion pathway protein I